MQFLRFLAAGVMNTALGLGLIYAAMATFADSGDWRRSLVAWLAVVGSAYAVQLGFVIGMHDVAGLDARIAQALDIPVYTVLTFLGARRFTFSKRSEI